MDELTTLDRAIRLQKVELFNDLETEMLALLASITRQIEVAKDEVVVEQGSPLEGLYVVLSGRIEMRRKGATLFSVGPDETLGNWALFDSQPSVVTAVAPEETWLLTIDREDFFELLADQPGMTREVFQALFKRVRSLLSAGLGSTIGDAAPSG